MEVYGDLDLFSRGNHWSESSLSIRVLSMSISYAKKQSRIAFYFKAVEDYMLIVGLASLPAGTSPIVQNILYMPYIYTLNYRTELVRKQRLNRKKVEHEYK